MNLIEKLGIEKCKQIVGGAPEGATHYWGSVKGEYAQKSHIIHNMTIFGDDGGSSTKVYKNDVWTTYYSSGYPNLTSLEDLRTAIANHGTPTNEGADNFSHFDHCSDIRNHISPNTKVIEK